MLISHGKTEGVNKSGKEVFDTTMNHLAKIGVSPEGLREFEKRIITFKKSDFIFENYSTHSDNLYPPGRKYKEYPPRAIFHFTGWLSTENKQGKDSCQHFAASIYNHMNDGGGIASANAFLTSDGQTLCILTKDDEIAFHALSFSNEARGIETPARAQSDISAEQYQGMIYAAAHWYLKDHPNQTTPLSMSSAKYYIIGHAEITELADEGNHTDFPLFVSDILSEHFMNLVNSEISNR